MIPNTPPAVRIEPSVDIRALLEDPHNPNLMPQSVLDTLSRVIGKFGFLQPVLVREARADELTTEAFDAAATVAAHSESRGRLPIFYEPIENAPLGFIYYVIIDGHHRVKAARQQGITHLPVIIVDVDANVASAIQIEMNKLHGELDLAKVGRNLTMLSDIGWSTDDLTITGYDPAEIDALLDKADLDPNADVMNGPVGGEEEDQDKPDKPFTLELTFATKAELTRAKKGLRKAAGGGRRPDLAKGLLALIDGDTEGD